MRCLRADLEVIDVSRPAGTGKPVRLPLAGDWPYHRIGAAVYVPKSSEHQILRQTLRRFLERECPRELVRRWDEDDYYPRAAVEKLRELGVFGLTTSEEYGGAGRDIPAALIAVEELARRSLTLSIAYIMGAFYGAVNIMESGSPAQKRELLPGLAAGEMLFAYGLSEPNVGADLASVETTADLRGDAFVVAGTKRWCTGAEVADYILTPRADRPGGRAAPESRSPSDRS